MAKIDHNSFSWLANKNSLTLTRGQGKQYGKYIDKDGLTPARRRTIEDIKEEKTYAELESKTDD